MKNITLANMNIFDLITLLCVAALTDTFSFVIQLLAKALYLISSVFCTKSNENLYASEFTQIGRLSAMQVPKPDAMFIT